MTAPSSLASLLRRHDRDRFLTALFAPAERRPDLFALYAFNFEVARIPEAVSEPLLGRIRFQWWRETLDAIYAGTAVRRHEVAEPLAATIRHRGLSRRHFDRLIDAREQDLAGAPPETMAALEAYAEDTSSSLVLLALEALGGAAPAALAASREIGIAYALAGLMRALPFHARRRRLYLPATLCAAAGIKPAEIFSRHPPQGLPGVVRAVAECAAAHLAAARARRDAVPRRAVPALLPAVLAEAHLRRLRAAGYDPFAARRLTHDPWSGWRLTLAALRGRY